MATAYIDDIFSPSKNFEEGIEHLEKIFATLTENGLTLNPKKCYSFLKTAKYLGFEINKDGVRPGEAKVRAVQDFPVPTSVHNVRQFLGLTGFFRKFISNYPAVSKPLIYLKRMKSLFGKTSKKRHLKT